MLRDRKKGLSSPNQKAGKKLIQDIGHRTGGFKSQIVKAEKVSAGRFLSNEATSHGCNEVERGKPRGDRYLSDKGKGPLSQDSKI